MKKNLKQALVPLAVMVFGVAAAFATNATKQSQSAQTMVKGYLYDSSQQPGNQCTQMDVWCSTIYNDDICVDTSAEENQLRHSTNNGLSCPTFLYKVI